VGAAVLALSLAVTGGLIPFGRHGASSAAAVLDAAARAAAATPDVTPRPGQFYYEKAIGAAPFSAQLKHDSASITCLQKVTYEQWVPSDMSGTFRTRMVEGGLECFHPGDLARLRAAGIALPKPGHVETSTLSLPSPKRPNGDSDLLMGNATPRQLRQLPTEPEALRRFLQDRLRRLVPAGSGGRPLEQRIFTPAVTLLLAPGAPAALRAALFQVLKSIPGVELLGRVTDPAGRPGTAVADTRGAVRSELIFDPATARALATVTVDGVVGPGAPPKGTVTNYYAILARGVVDSDSARP
jgi:hypothetical protein